MSSLLQKQSKSFASSMAAASSKFAKKTVANKPTTDFTSSHQRAPEARATAGPTVFSQPENTGTGNSIQTNIYYATKKLKEKVGQGPVSLAYLVEFAVPSHATKPYRDAFITVLKRHPQVNYDPTAFEGKGGCTFRSKHDIQDAAGLLKALQDLETFKGLEVKELKDGWPDADQAINELEAQHKVIVIRHKKDQSPRFVYYDNADWHMEIEPEFKDQYNLIKVPSDHQQLLNELVKEGQTPAGKKAKRDAPKVTKVEKPKKKVRRGGKITNDHLKGIFKDFSKMRR